jgi:ethanolamine ammonia-lyase large subunit
LRAGARDDTDRSDSPRRTGRPDLPEHLRQEKGLKEFGVTLEMLDEARDVGRQYNRVAGSNCLYFETGQGSALSANAHHGADQVTMEARNYGLARHYDPFLVNTVVGFIGPEYLYNSRQIIRAGLEDHFMGKLSGISMGCRLLLHQPRRVRPELQREPDHAARAAGCNYVMGMPMGDDIMLNYQTTAFHDTATVRQLLGLRPAPNSRCGWRKRESCKTAN